MPTVLTDAVRMVRIDLLQSRWLIAAFIATISVTAGIDLANAGIKDVETSVAMSSLVPALLLTPLTIALLVGAVVQSDSPSNGDAFWKVIPVSATSVVLAKTLDILLAVFCPLIVAQAIAMRGFTNSATEIATVTVQALFGLLSPIATAAILAAITPSTRTFLLGAIVWLAAQYGFYNAPFASGIMMRAWIDDLSRPGTTVPLLLQLIWLGLLYARRWTPAQARIVSVIILAGLALVPFAHFALAIRNADHSMTAISTAPATPSDFSATLQHDTVVVSFATEPPLAGQRFSLENVRATVVTSPGERSELFGLRADIARRGPDQIDKQRFRLHQRELMSVDSAVQPTVAKVRLEFRLVDRQKAAQLRRPGAAIEFAALLVTQTIDTLDAADSDTGVTQGYRKGKLRIHLVPDPEYGHILRAETWALTSDGEMKTAFESGDMIFTAGPAPKRPSSMAGLPNTFETSSYIVDQSGRDSVQLHTRGGTSNNLMLPIPFSTFLYGTRKFSGARALGAHESMQFELTDASTQRHRLVVASWRYLTHRELKATAVLK